MSIASYDEVYTSETYLLHLRDRELMLRCDCKGSSPNAQHSVERQYRAPSALYKAGIPVPKPYAFFKDATIIGRTFHIIDRVHGRGTSAFPKSPQRTGVRISTH